MSFALALVLLDGIVLLLDGDPNTITLHNRWRLRKMLFLPLMHKWLHLMNQLIDRAQANWTSQLPTPALFDRSSTLTQTTAKERIVLEIYPKPLKFFQDARRGKSHHDDSVGTLASELATAGYAPSSFQDFFGHAHLV